MKRSAERNSRRAAILGALVFGTLALGTLALGLGTPALAVQPDEILPDAQMEARAREVSKDLRCLVCQNQSIDDSNAPLARDLRLLVRERLKAGDDNKQVLDYITARYGDYVLLKPPFKASTYVLWLAPAVLLLLGTGAVASFYARRRRSAAATGGDTVPLSAEETQRLQKLLGEDGRTS